MAFSAMWIAIASFIYVFDIKKALDENGNPIELTHGYNSALVVYVSLFFLVVELSIRKCLVAKCSVVLLACRNHSSSWLNLVLSGLRS